MNQNQWANQPERGNRLALWLTTQIVRYLPPWLLPIAVSIISRYYYHTSPRARRNITRYQQRLQRTTPGLQLPKHAVYRQIRSFAEAIADRFAVWQHRLTYQDRKAQINGTLSHITAILPSTSWCTTNMPRPTTAP